MPHTIDMEDFIDYTFEDVAAACASKRLTVIVEAKTDKLIYEIKSRGVVTIAYKFEDAMKLYNELP